VNARALDRHVAAPADRQGKKTRCSANTAAMATIGGAALANQRPVPVGPGGKASPGLPDPATLESVVLPSIHEARAEHVSRFVAWLRAAAANVVVLEGGSARRSAATANKHLAASLSFYDYHAWGGVVLAMRWSSGGARAVVATSPSSTT
jgi:hypothetical protein